MDNKLKVVTIGGGSSYTPELVAGFIKLYDKFPLTELWLVDIEEGSKYQEINASFARRMFENANVPVKVYTTLNRREALVDADFVSTQLRVGRIPARINDERIPLKYGIIGQETNGPGGMMKAFRTIPVIIDICKDMEELCPDAWLINYTNPAGIVTEAIHRHSKLKKVIGLCSGPLSIKQDIAKLLEVDANKLYVEFAGINHMVFAKKVLLDGRNVTKDAVERHIKSMEEAKLVNIAALPWEAKFIRSLGMIPIDYLKYYLKNDEMVAKQVEDASKHQTRAEVVEKIEEELFELYQDESLIDRPELLKQRGGAWYSEAATELMTSIYNDARDIHTMNVVNNGAITNLPNDVVVEVNCLVTKAEVLPITTDPLPTSVVGLVSALKSMELLTIDAAVSCDYDKALLAFTMNPLVPSDTLAKKVLDELLDVNKDNLPKEWNL